MSDIVKDMFKTVFGGGMFDKILDILTINPTTGEYAIVWVLVESIYKDIMVPVALALMIVWFLVAFIEKAASEQVTFEQIFLLTAKLIAAKWIIENGLDIFATLWSLGISLTRQIYGVINSPGGLAFDTNALWKSLTGQKWSEDLGLVKSLGVAFQLLLPWIASLIMSGIATFICYSRLLELLTRIIFAPVAVSDFITEGLRGSGWRYLKNFLAIALQGAFIICISGLFSRLMAGVVPTTGEFWDVLIKYLVFSFAACALMFKSLSLSKEIVGVQ